MESKALPVRAIKQSQHYFLKQRYREKADFTKNFGLSFQPHEIRIRSITCTVPAHPHLAEVGLTENAVMYRHIDEVFTLYMEGIGDICAYTETTDRVVDYSFKVRSAIDSQQNFQIRDVNGTPRVGRMVVMFPGDPLVYLPVDLIIHMEFIEYAKGPTLSNPLHA